ncbi:ATP synthase F(0) complex subunit C2, mitochondrial-like, partial [Meriones unguiculatus]|uniref:ATP synthase F(0) complex subunit C2, mitochondrial-like n=1 Tax=Meriones unguiculatus TaxID=10047 RepID=UPI00293EB906
LAVQRPLTSLISSRSFQTSTISRDMDTAAKFVVAGAVSYARNLSLKQQLFYAILGFALSAAMRLFCLTVALLILFAT